MKPDTCLMEYIHKHFSPSGNTFADDITYKGTNYTTKNYHCVLLHTKGRKEFEIGVIRKFIFSGDFGKDRDILIIYEKTKMKLMEDFGIYNVDLSNEFYHVNIKTLANYVPIHLFSVKSFTEAPKLYMSLKTTPYLK